MFLLSFFAYLFPGKELALKDGTVRGRKQIWPMLILPPHPIEQGEAIFKKQEQGKILHKRERRHRMHHILTNPFRWSIAQAAFHIAPQAHLLEILGIRQEPDLRP